MPFGLCNAPSTFQALMNEVLLPFLNISVVVYLDDILVYSNSLSNHMIHVKQVLQRLRDYKLYAKFTKCIFFCTEVEFLGYIVTREGFAIAPSKVEAIQSWPIPSTRSKLKGFLGLANYCRKFIDNFSTQVLPLTQLTSPNTPFIWSPKAQLTFEKTKALFISTPVLLMPDINKPFHLETDASNFAVGGVLLQLGGTNSYILLLIFRRSIYQQKEIILSTTRSYLPLSSHLNIGDVTLKD